MEYFLILGALAAVSLPDEFPLERGGRSGGYLLIQTANRLFLELLDWRFWFTRGGNHGRSTVVIRFG